ncbi:MAG: PEP-CTERM sorting domain-containing protein [Akkermansia sp.]|nr:PEP-CTERM sorting domain-containing protein [Akkermansia sp.]
MKKTLIALLALGSVTMADTTTYTPLTSSADWTTGHNNPSKGKVPSINNEDGVLTYTSGDWSRGYAHYSFADSGLTLEKPGDSLTITFTIETSNTNCVDTLTLIGSDKAITLGAGNYGTNVQLGTSTTTTGNFYNYKDNSDANGRVKSDVVGSVGTIAANTPVVLTMAIAWDDTKNQFVATATGTSSQTVDLGTSYTLSALNLSVDGSSLQKMSALSVAYTTTTDPAPEPTTGALSLLALAGMVARRRRK